MFLPRKWVFGLALLSAAPALTFAGPFDFAQSKSAQPAAEAAAGRGNQEVAQDIAKALGGAQLVHKNVQIEFKSGVARITGQIKDNSQKALVTQIVGQVPSVESVRNDLQVMEAAAPSNPGAIQQAAAEDPRGGVTPAVHQASPGSAQRVRPVSHESRPASNQQVAHHIAQALTKAGLSGQEIEVRYKDGTASLIGNVEDAEQAQRAEMAARSVPGVNGVINRLSPASGVQPVGYEQGYGQPMMPPGQGYPQFDPNMGGYPGGPQYGAPPVQQMQYSQPGMAPQGMPQYGNVQQMGHRVYNQPNLPQYAWPAYAQYDNYAAVTYPKQYDAQAWPYIGPYYPYPQVPMEWREATLEWDDGYWNLKFNSRTDKWWWFMNPNNWHK